MKKLITPRHIKAHRTRNPGEIVRILGEVEKITLPEKLYYTAIDICETVRANTHREFEEPELVVAYLLRYAYLLQESGELVEALPKPSRKKKAATLTTT